MIVVVRVALAAVFAYAAVMKIRRRGVAYTEAEAVVGRVVSRLAVAAAVVLELLLAVFVLVVPAQLWATVMGLAVLGMITGYYGLQLVRTDEERCSCFGAAPYASGDTRPVANRVGAVVGHVALNGVLALGWLEATGPGSLSERVPAALAATLGPAGIVIAALTTAVVRVTLRARITPHPQARSMTVDVVRLGQCKRLLGRLRPDQRAAATARPATSAPAAG